MWMCHGTETAERQREWGKKFGDRKAKAESS